MQQGCWQSAQRKQSRLTLGSGAPFQLRRCRRSSLQLSHSHVCSWLWTAMSVPGYGLAGPAHGLTSWLDLGPAPSPRTCLMSCTLGCTWLPSQGQRERALPHLQHPLLSQPCSGPAAAIADPNWQRLPWPSEGCKHAPLAVPPDTSHAAGLGKRH